MRICKISTSLSKVSCVKNNVKIQFEVETDENCKWYKVEFLYRESSQSKWKSKSVLFENMGTVPVNIKNGNEKITFYKNIKTLEFAVKLEIITGN